jgi:hypothetical protein
MITSEKVSIKEQDLIETGWGTLDLEKMMSYGTLDRDLEPGYGGASEPTSYLAFFEGKSGAV